MLLSISKHSRCHKKYFLYSKIDNIWGCYFWGVTVTISKWECVVKSFPYHFVPHSVFTQFETLYMNSLCLRGCHCFWRDRLPLVPGGRVDWLLLFLAPPTSPLHMWNYGKSLLRPKTFDLGEFDGARNNSHIAFKCGMI